ncbi:S-layer glycoprotein N-glycosyltransferase AglJ [Halovivax limisalsi]|uniref:S-layer glycoprotein N-glycosyltransferase AglJ n=1 Tax=Halovivax limisalsi TaxID=1453760 RepID=UPI001FFCFF47|nr:S-layer glycoprotein N-glycosyltransferase AglJ [Halovivax limisalsi]
MAPAGTDGRVPTDAADREPSTSIPKSAVCVLIPTLNEAATIGDIVDAFREDGYENVLVVDGDSTDDTRAIAAEHGARVITQTGSGKGRAVREGVARIDVPYVVMLDGDGTYDPADADRLLAALAEGYEHVIGNRFADMEPGAMSRLNSVGNSLINGAFETIHGAEYVDILSGYRAFTVDSFERCHLSADGFTIETELAVECVKQGVATTVVPISYSPRPDESETNLHPIRDGGRIIVALYSLARTNNPLFYFGTIGVGATLLGSFVATFVLYQWIVNGVGHNILALVSAAAILLGVQLLIFGVLSDMIVSLHRDQRRRLDRLAGDLRRRAERDDGIDRSAPRRRETEFGGRGASDDGSAGADDRAPADGRPASDEQPADDARSARARRGE